MFAFSVADLMASNSLPDSLLYETRYFLWTSGISKLSILILLAYTAHRRLSDYCTI